MPGISKNKNRRTDNLGTHVESLRVGETPGLLQGMAAGRSDAALRLFLRKRRADALGIQPYSTESRLCDCGNVALRVWRNKGYCKGCFPSKGVR